MADLYPIKKTANGPATVTDPSTLKAAAAAAATTYTPYPSDPDGYACVSWNIVRFGIDYKPGSETSIEWYPEGWDGVAWRTLLAKATQASGYSILTPDPYQMVAATFTTFAGAGVAGKYVSPRFDCAGLQKIRVQEKYTGSAPSAGRTTYTATLGMDIVNG